MRTLPRQGMHEEYFSRERCTHDNQQYTRNVQSHASSLPTQFRGLLSTKTRIPEVMGKVSVKQGKKGTKKQPEEKHEADLNEVVTGEGVHTPLLHGGDRVRKRSIGQGDQQTNYQSTRRGDRPRYQPTNWDDSLPYGGKVYLARRKRPDSWLCIMLQVAVVIGALGMVFYAWYHGDHFHYHITKVYAHLGHSHAQATVGHKLLNGKGVEANHTAAMEWFRKAADQGHPQAAYNIAIGYLQGHNTGLQPGDAHRLIKEAASKGVPEAEEVLEKVCSRGHCDV